MKRAAVLLCAAIAGAVLTMAATVTWADECEDIVAALNKRMDQIRSARKEGDSRTIICARLGRVSGMTQAVGIVAEECFDEGPKRDELIKSSAEWEKALEVDNVCN
jgi:hypothetical protein